MAAPAVSAVVVNYQGGEELRACLRSLSEQDVAVEIVVVDNGDDALAAAAVAERDEARLVRPGRNLGFAAGANLGAAESRAPIVLFLNPDVTLTPGCLGHLVRALGESRTGVAGPALQVAASGTREYGGTVDAFGYPVTRLRPGRPLYVPGCALATRRDAFDVLGGFDERFFMFAEDVDYCWRALLAGWDVRVVPDAVALHVGGASTPGGYLRGDGLATTQFRVALRERNTLAMLLKCQRPGPAVATALTYPLQALVTASALALAGKRSTARAIVAGLAWNARELPETLSRRRTARRSGGAADREVRARRHRGLRKLELLVRHGLPRVDESTARAAAP